MPSSASIVSLCLACSLLLSTTAFAAPLSPDGVKGQYEGLLGELKSIQAQPEAWAGLLLRWNDLKAFLSGESSRRSFRENQNTASKEAEQESRFMREKILPIAEEYDAKLRQAMLNSPCRSALETRFGKLLFSNWEVEQSAFDPKNIELNTEVANLVARYNKLTGAARVTLDGEALTIPQASALLEHPDEAKRKAAWLAINGWYHEHAGELEDLYSKLLGLRHRIALNLNQPSFVPVGYRKLQRTDYGPEDVKRFREGVKKYVVPLLYRFRKKQAEQLGASTLKPWNAGFYPGLSLDPNILKVEEELPMAQKLFDRLHPTLGNHFRKMVQEGLIDHQNRPNKRSGAYCTTFDDEKKALVFANNTGASGDVGTLTHEMGHAFQAWESSWIEPLELRWPTLEACEVHSMGMEYLTLPLLDEFFRPEDAQKYRKLKIVDSLTLFPYVATVDEFQHWIYEHPDHTAAQRDEAWDRIWDSYNVGLDFAGVEHLKSARWLRQGHIFRVPFYYIDYAIAETGALQLFELDQTDHARAMDSYLKLCRIGGSQSLLQIFRTGQLASPFQSDTLKPLMERVAQELDLD